MSDLRTYLHRYWFRWAHDADTRVGGALGCGVSAVDLEDAKWLIDDVLDGDPLPPVAEVVEDVDVRTLDAGHVLSNMGDPTTRGVWFPQQ